MSDKAIKTLRKELGKARRDEFPDGTVIRWVASDRYVYVALKTMVGWFTTARPGNPFVPSVTDYEGLVEILTRAEVTDVEVATDWELVLQ